LTQPCSRLSVDIGREVPRRDVNRMNEGESVCNELPVERQMKPVAKMGRGSSGLRANARGESTRATLLAAALRSFADKSYHGTGTRDIAEQAGLSQAAVYAHYSSKEELLLRICLDGFAEIEEVVRAAELRASRPEDQLREWVYDFVVWHLRTPARTRVIYDEMRALSDAKAEEVWEIRRRVGRRLRQIIASGVERGRFSVPDTYLTAAAMMSMGIDAARWYGDDGTWSTEEVGERYRDLATRMVGYEGSRDQGAEQRAPRGERPTTT
jgi:AcrR family transcriptional regulator